MNSCKKGIHCFKQMNSFIRRGEKRIGWVHWNIDKKMNSYTAKLVQMNATALPPLLLPPCNPASPLLTAAKLPPPLLPPSLCCWWCPHTADASAALPAAAVPLPHCLCCSANAATLLLLLTPCCRCHASATLLPGCFCWRCRMSELIHKLEVAMQSN